MRRQARTRAPAKVSVARSSNGRAPGGRRRAGAVSNRAFSQWVTSARSGRSITHGAAPRPLTVHRYEAGEHSQWGGSGKVVIKGVELTEGEITALAGDFYESVDDMRKADPKELRKLRDLVRDDQKARTGGGGLPVSNDAWQEATQGRPEGQRYLDLASRNDSHFAGPGSAGAAKLDGGAGASASGGGGRDHRSRWEALHRQALDAVQAAQAVQETMEQVASSEEAPVCLPGHVPEDAVLLNSFAAHFLTDAFAAGHLVNKQDITDAARTYWDKLGSEGILFKENNFTKALAKRVLANQSVRDAFKDKELKVARWGPVNEQRLSEFLYGFSDDKEKSAEFFDSFAKVVHDKLNEAIEGGKGHGIHVTNAKGDNWELSGDGTLHRSKQETRVIAQKAVEESNRNLQVAANTTGSLDYEALFKGVWDYTPGPTEKGGKQIQDTIATFADAGKAEALDAFHELTLRELPLVMRKLEDENRLRDKKRN